MLMAVAGCSADIHDEDAPLQPRLATMGDVSDDFERPDSLVLGATAQGHEWIESGDGDAHARILNNELFVHYFDPSSIGTVYTNVADYRARDLALRVQMKGNTTGYMSDGRFFGVAWRMADQDGAWDSAGYHLRIEATGVSIAAGSLLLAQCQATMPIDTGWHTYDVESVGRRHRVLIDDVEVIDCLDDSYTDEGYVGLHAYYSIFSADDFDVEGIESPPPTYPRRAEYSASDQQASIAVGDDFRRGGSTTVLGSSSGGITWLEEGGANEHVSVIVTSGASNELRLHYFAGGTTQVRSWAVMDGLTLRDIELHGRARGYDETYMTDRPFGFSYRLQGPAVAHDDPGYHLLIEASGVRLMAGTTQVAASPGPVDAEWHEYRIKAVGDRHRVFMDGSEIIDVVDATYPDAGRLGVAGYYSISLFDDIVVRDLPMRAVGQPFSDDFERSDGHVLGTIADGTPWLEEGDGDEHVGVLNGTLRMHYFQGGSTHARSWAVMEEPSLQNVELRGRARGHSETYMTDRPFGFSYRLQGAAVAHDDPGYHVLVETSGVQLMAGTTEVASWAGAVDTAWHDYRIEAVGDHHRVFMDDEPIIDVIDATYPSAGRVGVAGHYSVSYFDHLSVRALPVEGIDPRTLDMTQFYWSVSANASTVAAAKTDGANAGHNYLSVAQQANATTAAEAVEDYVSTMARHSMATLATLSGQFKATELSSVPSIVANVAASIEALDTYGNVSAWYLPEELRYWVVSEREEGLHLRDWAEAYDPERRPVLMYSPNNAKSSRFHHEFEWAHVLAAGAYVHIAPGLSRAWARWKVKELLWGIHGDVHLGTDHEQGGRTPMIAGWCYPNVVGLDDDEAYNFVFSTLAEGARGIGVWSYFHGSNPNSDCLPGYAAAFEMLSDPTHPLGRVLLHGSHDRSFGVSVTSGEVQTEAFVPLDGATAPQRIPSVVATLMLFDGKRYIVAANSRDDEVTVAFNHAGRSGAIEVLGESRTLPMTGGAFSDVFAARAVHLYWLPTGSP